MKKKRIIIPAAIAFAVVLVLAFIPFMGNIFSLGGSVASATTMSAMFASSEDGCVSYDSESHTVTIDIVKTNESSVMLDADDKVFTGEGIENAIELKVVINNKGGDELLIGVSDTTIISLQNLVNIDGSVIYTHTGEDFRSANVLPGETLEFSVRYILIDCGLNACGDVPLVISIATL